MGLNPCFKAFSYPLNDLKKGSVTTNSSFKSEKGSE